MNSLINKYGILLSIFYPISLVLSNIGILISPLDLVYYFATNIVVALIVSLDLKKNKIKSSIIIWSTILFSILGVTLLLLKIMKKGETAST